MMDAMTRCDAARWTHSHMKQHGLLGLWFVLFEHRHVRLELLLCRQRPLRDEILVVHADVHEVGHVSRRHVNVAKTHTHTHTHTTTTTQLQVSSRVCKLST
jgi:hypothetical protein